MLARPVSRVREDEGASAVEFALVWLVLALFLIGIVQFGLIFNQWLQMEHAAREGARWAGLRNESDYVIDRIVESAPGLELTPADITITPGDPVAAIPNTPISVRIDHEVMVITPLMEAIFGTEVEMSATSTQRVE